MAQFFGLIPINAANFESGAAGDGQVLTADGAGNAAWEDAAAGGGGFAYDGATFTPSTFVVNQAWRDVTIQLTTGGVAVADGKYKVSVYTTGSGYTEAMTMEINVSFPYFIQFAAPQGYEAMGAFWQYTTVGVLVIRIRSTNPTALDAQVHVCIPSGSVVSSGAISIPGTG